MDSDHNDIPSQQTVEINKGENAQHIDQAFPPDPYWPSVDYFSEQDPLDKGTLSKLIEVKFFIKYFIFRPPLF